MNTKQINNLLRQSDQAAQESTWFANSLSNLLLKYPNITTIRIYDSWSLEGPPNEVHAFMDELIRLDRRWKEDEPEKEGT